MGQRFRLTWDGPEYTSLLALRDAMRERARGTDPSDRSLAYNYLGEAEQDAADQSVRRCWHNAADLLERWLEEATIDQDLLTDLLGAEESSKSLRRWDAPGT